MPEIRTSNLVPPNTPAELPPAEPFAARQAADAYLPAKASAGNSGTLRRSRSLSALTTVGPKAPEDVTTCPIGLTTMVDPVNGSDGYLYEASIVKDLKGVSPFTRGPLTITGQNHVVRAACHEQDKDAAAQYVLRLAARDKEKMTGTAAAPSALSATSAARLALLDEFISYQRRNRSGHGQGVFPDKFSQHVFSHFGIVESKHVSSSLVSWLTKQGILGKNSPGSLPAEQMGAVLASFRYHMAPGVSRFAGKPLSADQQERCGVLIHAYINEYARRRPLVRQANQLHRAWEALLPTETLYRELKPRYDAAVRELVKLPSGAAYAPSPVVMLYI